MLPCSLRFSGLALFLLAACGDDAQTGPGGGGGGGDDAASSTAATGGGFPTTDRAWGDRTPLTDACDDIDAERCLLPWPNDAFTVADTKTETGLRLAVDIGRMNPLDEPSGFGRADGFSRVSPLVASFAEPIDPDSAAGAIHLYLSEKDAAGRGDEVPLRVEVVAPEDPDDETVLVADPKVPLEPDATYTVVIDGSLRDTAGDAIAPSHFTDVALGRTPAASEDEAAVYGHYAPTRAFLDTIGQADASVTRVWEYTTRSAEDPRKRLRQMVDRATSAVDDGDVEVVIESVETPEDGSVAAIVRGHLAGLPQFLGEDGLLVDDAGDAREEGTRDAPFRVAIPRGEGDYRMIMFGHGTGGSVDDDAFDQAITEAGAAKVSFELYGWTGSTVIQTFIGLQDIARGSARASGGLVQAVADGAAIRRAMSGTLGDTLAADELAGAPNPHAGRRPDDSTPLWLGGSLGGTMGLLFTAASPDMEYAVLNVPGAAWTSWVRHAAQFSYIEPFLAAQNHGPQRVPLAVAMGQVFFDECDGASWIDVVQGEHPIVALAQESIGDPVLPNPGSEMVGQVLGAKLVGVPLVPIDGLERADEAVNESGLTQYWVSEDPDDEYAVHGFAAKDTPAAAAATEQVIAFAESVWAGEPRITVPSGCGADGCDFRE